MVPPAPSPLWRGAQVLPEAFDTLVECITQADFDICEAVPKGDPSGRLVNPLGGVSVDMAGPAR